MIFWNVIVFLKKGFVSHLHLRAVKRHFCRVRDLVDSVLIHLGGALGHYHAAAEEDAEIGSGCGIFAGKCTAWVRVRNPVRTGPGTAVRPEF